MKKRTGMASPADRLQQGTAGRRLSQGAGHRVLYPYDIRTSRHGGQR